MISSSFIFLDPLYLKWQVANSLRSSQNLSLMACASGTSSGHCFTVSSKVVSHIKLMLASQFLRWPSSAHQIQITHTKFKSLTPNSNRPHRIQIAHTEFTVLTPNSNRSHQIQIDHTKFKFLTLNSNHSHQIQITHTEYKLLTPNSNHSHQIQITHTEFKSPTPNLNYPHQT